MEKKLTNSGPLREPADKHSIYTLKLTPCGRTRALEQRIPWSHRCILDTPAWACRRYILRGIWLHRSPHQL